MNLYLLTRTDRAGYDENRAFVVAAVSPQGALSIAESVRADEPEGTWVENSRIELLGAAEPTIKAGIILRDFNAG